MLKWVESNCREECSGAKGYRFSDKGSGIWPEGAAQLAVGYRYLGDRKQADAILDEVLRISPCNREDGRSAAASGIPAAYPNCAYTGFIKEFAPGVVDKWVYPARQHLGATVWFLFAVRGTNPYWLEGTPSCVK